MNRFRCTLILLFLFSPELMANTVANGNIETGLFSIPLEDRSLYYLSQLFGSVHGTLMNFADPEKQLNGQLFSNIFNIFNIILMTFGLLLITYNNILTSVAAGQQGSMMAQKWSSPWIAFRSAVSFGLLAPFNHGYSIAQSILMTLVIQGVGLANGVWNIALDYYEQGYQLASISENKDVFGDDIIDIIDQIAEQAFCAAYYNEYYALPDDKPRLTTNIWPERLPSEPSKESWVHFSVGEKVEPGSTHFGKVNQICGRMSMQLKAVPIKSDKSTQAAVLYEILNSYRYMFDYYYTVASEALIKSLNVMGPDETILKKTHATMALKNTNTITNTHVNIDGPVLFKAALGPSNATIRKAAVAREQQLAYDRGDSGFTDDPATQIEKSRQQGWLFAASFYGVLQSKHVALENLSVTLPLELKYSPNEAVLDGFMPSEAVEWADTAKTRYFNHSSQEAPDPDDLEAIKHISFTDQAASPLSTEAPRFDRFSRALLSNLATKISQKFMRRMTEGSEELRADDATGKRTKYVDPIFAMQALGYDLLHAAEWAMTSSIIIGFLASLLGMVMSSANPFKVTIDTLLSFMFGFVAFLLTVIVAPGCILAAYLPMIPFYLFLFATVSWLILCIEGMVAIPLTILGMNLPGQGLLGKGTPGLHLAISIALRPVLMVIGFLMGARLLMTVFTMWNYAAQATVMSVWGGSLGIFSIPMVLTLYTGVSMILAQQSWSLIYNVPDKTCAWIGGQIERSSTAHLAQEAEHKAEQGGAMVSTLGKGVLSAAQKKSEELGNKGQSGKSGQSQGESGQSQEPGKAAASSQ